MPVFHSNPYRSAFTSSNSPFHRISNWYRRALPNHPHLLFGLPFVTLMVAGSFFLTPATALRYERHDRRVQQVTREEALGLKDDGVEETGEQGQKGRKGIKLRTGRKAWDINEEYYRLAAKDIDNWQQKRVKRLPGERDGRL